MTILTNYDQRHAFKRVGCFGELFLSQSPWYMGDIWARHVTTRSEIRSSFPRVSWYERRSDIKEVVIIKFRIYSYSGLEMKICLFGCKWVRQEISKQWVSLNTSDFDFATNYYESLVLYLTSKTQINPLEQAFASPSMSLTLLKFLCLT